MGFGDRSTGRGTFGGEFATRHYIQWGLDGVQCTCATVPQPSELRFGLWGGACGRPRHCCIIWGQRRATGTGGFGGFCFPFSQWEMPLGRFRFVCGNLTTFPFGKHIVGKLDSWALRLCCYTTLGSQKSKFVKNYKR